MTGEGSTKGESSRSQGISPGPWNSGATAGVLQPGMSTDAKIDTIMTMVQTMQSSLRELHNEFNVLKPRMSVVNTTQGSGGMIVRQKDGSGVTDEFLAKLSKRKKKI